MRQKDSSTNRHDWLILCVLACAGFSHMGIVTAVDTAVDTATVAAAAVVYTIALNAR